MKILLDAIKPLFLIQVGEDGLVKLGCETQNFELG
jgi:hypothetical protein